MSLKLSLRPLHQPHVLTIAGSDSSGGAGIQADLKTIAAFGCYGSSVLTGLTAQNTKGVQDVHAVPAPFVLKQLESIFDDEVPIAIKIGMLTSSSIISTIVNYIRDLPSRPLIILDPVMVSTSGHDLLPEEALDAIRGDLLSNVDWITPNIPEAKRLTGWDKEVKTLLDMRSLAGGISEVCDVPTILLKGGHLSIELQEILALEKDCTILWAEGDAINATGVLSLFRSYLALDSPSELVVDIMITKGELLHTLIVGRKVDSTSTHGTGCTLSSALACVWAIESRDSPRNGLDTNQRMVLRAVDYTRTAIATAFPFGSGHGPLNHSYQSTVRSLPPPTNYNPHPFVSYLISSDPSLWASYVKHPFVVQIGKGTLPQASFLHYIKQDYHYLRHYARAHSLGAYKSTAFEDIKAFSDIALFITEESEMHVNFCSKFGISRGLLLDTPESAACSAYARYILDVGAQGDILDLYVAVASCLIGYGEVGLWLRDQVDAGHAVLEGNVYREWIETYFSKDFLAAVNKGIENLERRIAEDPPSPIRTKQLAEIWHECVRLEKGFWDMSMTLSM